MIIQQREAIKKIRRNMNILNIAGILYTIASVSTFWILPYRSKVVQYVINILTVL